MSSKQQIVDLLQEQIVEVGEHKQKSALQSVIECIQEDLLEENREWTLNDINDWKSTMDSQGLCQTALEIFQFILDCLYKSKSFVSGKSNNKYDEENFNESSNKENNLKVDNFFQTQIEDKNEYSIDQQQRNEIKNKIKKLQESIQTKEMVILDAEDQLQQKYKQAQNETESEGWQQFEKEKIQYLKEKSEILGQLEDIFLEIDAIKELVEVRDEIKKIIEEYNIKSIQKLQDELNDRLKNYSFVIDDIRKLLNQLHSWDKKYPLCTDKSVNLFIEIENNDQYLNKMLQQVNNLYNDQMLSELEGLHDVLTELEQVRNQNNQNK